MNRALKYLITMTCGLTLLISSNLSTAHRINTISITADTLEAAPDCLHYRIVGVCFWLVCGFWGCVVETTPKVDHYLPDVVVTTYPRYGSDPWFEINHTLDKADHLAGNKTFSALNDGMNIQQGAMNSAQSSDSDVKLREVNVIGNPALEALHLGGFALLKGQATPYVPYYQSQLDAKSWRSGLLEQLYPQSWIPGKDDVGTFLTNEWGAVYPRQGFIMQPNVGKASAVIAVRGANIATTHSYNHLSKDLAANHCPEHQCKTPGAIASDASDVEWQMILPDKQTECHDRIDYQARPAWTQHQPDNQAYSWIVWREYRGCIQGHGHYLGSAGG